jgi:hypothetical protein
MTQLTPTLDLTEQRDGWWLYDTTRGMNLSMRAKTEQAAFVEALTYYQSRLTEVEKSYNSLNEKVEAFVSQFVEEDEEIY